jgi:antagonist of KipI
MPEVMGSRSTDLRAGVGGFQGRALKAGDVLNTLPVSIHPPLREDMGEIPEGLSFHQADWAVGTDVRPAWSATPTLRVTRGGEFDDFTLKSRSHFF